MAKKRMLASGDNSAEYVDNPAGDAAIESMSENAPAPRISKYEQALMEMLLNPEYRFKSVAEICRVIGCDDTVYYRAFKKPHFVKEYEDRCMLLTTKHLGPVINACVREAVRGSHQHAKIILTMAGLYSDKMQVTGKDGAPINMQVEIAVLPGLSDDALRQLLGQSE